MLCQVTIVCLGIHTELDTTLANTDCVSSPTNFVILSYFLYFNAKYGSVYKKSLVTSPICRSQWPRGLRRRSAAVRLLRLWVRIPPGAWMFVCCECCVSVRGLCDGLITRPEESCRLLCVVVCDLEKPEEWGGHSPRLGYKRHKNTYILVPYRLLFGFRNNNNNNNNNNNCNYCIMTLLPMFVRRSLVIFFVPTPYLMVVDVYSRNT